MEDLQRELGREAVFHDDLGFEPADINDAVVAGVDQSFMGGQAVSAVVAMKGEAVVERVHAVTATDMPYVPGLLSFREGKPILKALESLSVEPDLLVVDGSGRIHFREAGIATHIGVTVDKPSLGVAKNLLCGTPGEPLERGLPRGTRIPVYADEGVEAPDGVLLGYAYQSKQYDGDRHVNPVYVSPGHRVGAETAVDLVEAMCRGYKLPEPVRLADRYADEAKKDYGQTEL